MQLRRKRKKTGLWRKPKLDNARKLRGIFFIDPEDGEYEENMKNARRNWKILWKLEDPLEAAVLCKMENKKTCLEVTGNCCE